MTHLTDTNFWHDLIHGIAGPRKGGARIIVDSEDASTGVGKTGLAVYIALLISRAFGYSMQQDDLTLSGAAYLDRWRHHPGAEQPSVIILDELGGAGAGQARRAMAQQNVDLSNAWQLMRKKRIVSIVTLPHWSKADKSLRKQADYRLWCLREPIGYFRPYQVGADFNRGNVRTSGYDDVDRIRFPNLDANDSETYEYLSKQKDELLNSGFFDADKLQEDDSEDEDDGTLSDSDKERIKNMAKTTSATQEEIAEVFDIGRSTVSKVKNDAL
jgi:predicted XRE-type DNA-binding protein